MSALIYINVHLLSLLHSLAISGHVIWEDRMQDWSTWDNWEEYGPVQASNLCAGDTLFCWQICNGAYIYRFDSYVGYTNITFTFDVSTNFGESCVFSYGTYVNDTTFKWVPFYFAFEEISTKTIALPAVTWNRPDVGIDISAYTGDYCCYVSNVVLSGTASSTVTSTESAIYGNKNRFTIIEDGTWFDDFQLTRNVPYGWNVTGDLSLTNGSDVYYGPFHNNECYMTRHFQCEHDASVILGFSEVHSNGAASSDWIQVAYVSAITSEYNGTHDYSRVTDPIILNIDNDQRWYTSHVSYNGQNVSENQVFMIQFKVHTYGANDYIGLYNISISCDPLPTLWPTFEPTTYPIDIQASSSQPTNEAMSEVSSFITTLILVSAVLFISLIALICALKYLFKRNPPKENEDCYELLDVHCLNNNVSTSGISQTGDRRYLTENDNLDVNYAEIGEDDHDDDDQIYAKPAIASVGQQPEIIHFYYKDFEIVSEKELYHERQKWEMCLMHAMNALLQRQEFTVERMNDICKELAPNKLINPHKSVLQTGNYDANVLMMALGKVSIEVQWFDARKANELDLNNDKFLNFLESENCTFVGFILNNPSNAFKMFSRRHWISIKQINGEWYNLDSKLQNPQKYKDASELSEYLVYSLRDNSAELMICRQKKSESIVNLKQASVEMNALLEW